jgi:acetylornithine deacetylase/succinyl-diaminopimelate desuccinylase-like protein
MTIARYVLLCLLAPLAAPAAQIDWDQVGDEATALLRDYIRIDTSNPPGREMAAARFFAKHFERAGIEHRILESEPDRASIVAWLPGRGEGKPIVLLNHLDTVPADPAAWSHPPHAAVVDDGYLYGRGALDCKGLAVAEAMAMIALARARERLGRDVIFLGTAEEETGGKLGAGWFAENHLELLRGAEFMLNEGGHGRRLDDGALVYEVSAVEKTPFWLRLTAQGPAGHGSTPQGTPAVERLVRALERVRNRTRDIRVTQEVDAYYKALAERESAELAARYRDLARALEDASFREVFLTRPEDAALVQSTISITVLQGSEKTNVVPPRASAELDCRLLPGETPEEFLATLRTLIDDDEIDIEVLLSFPPSASSTDTDLYRAIERVAATEGAAVLPVVLRGFTDSHYFREKGITVYGLIPAVVADVDIRRMHGVDERIPVAELGAGTKRLVHILRELDTQN